MKLREQKDLKNKATTELRQMLKEARKSLFDLQMDKALGKNKNTRLKFWKRKEIAYLLTHLARKEQTNG